MLTKLFREIKYLFSLCLSVQNLGLLLIVTIIDSFASGFLAPIFAPYLRGKGINLVEIGYIFSIAAVLPMILQPIMGELSDRIGRKVLMVGTAFVTSMLTPLYVIFNNAWFIGIVQATNVTIERSASPARNAMLADVAPTKDRASVFAALGSVNNLAYGASLFFCGIMLAGLSIAGFTLFKPFSMTTLFWLAAVLYIVAAVTLTIFLKETAPVKLKEQEQQQEQQQNVASEGQDTAAPPQDQPGAEAPAEVQQPKQRFARLRAYFALFGSVIGQSRTMKGLLLYQFFFSFSLGVYFVYVPIMATALGAPDSWLGPIVAMSWLTFAIGQPVGGRLSDRSKARKVFIVWGMFLLALCNIGVAGSQLFVPDGAITSPGLALAVMVFFWALLGIPDAISRPCGSALIVDIVAPKERGRVFGVLGSAGTLGGIIAPISYGYLAEYVGIWSAFVAAGVAVAAAAISVALLVEEPEHEEEPEAAQS